MKDGKLIDIIEIHQSILQTFKDEQKTITTYKIQLKDINKILNNPSPLSTSVKKKIKNHQQKLVAYIQNLESKNRYHYYILQATPLIEEYKKILNTPICVSFMGYQAKPNDKKIFLIKKFLKLAQSYTSLKQYPKPSPINMKCEGCESVFFESKDHHRVCVCCGRMYSIDNKTNSYKDINRVNMSSKYTYDRKIHFRDCIKQYQGKQNVTIDPAIYKELIVEFDNHGLLIDKESDPKEIRFKNITKEHIMLFLKVIKCTKHYEDITLIHYTLTGKAPPNLEAIEQKLLADFDVLTVLYDKVYKSDKNFVRKNFINTQYVLFQLLRRHKFKCKRKDFNILKTIDRKSFHDEICKNLFQKLGWNFTALF